MTAAELRGSGRARAALCALLTALACARPEPGVTPAPASPRPAGQRCGGWDIAVLVDRSQATAAASGADLDGDGHLSCQGLSGFWAQLRRQCSAGGDSVLAAQLRAVRALLPQLDPASSRIALVAFSGERWSSVPDAELITPLTAQFDELERGLEQLARTGSGGWRNLEEALRIAARELLEPTRPRATGPEPRRLALLLAAGMATLPDFRDPAANSQLALQQASAAAERGIRIDSYALGSEAAPVFLRTLRSIAEGSRGRFTRTARSAELQLHVRPCSAAP